MSVRLLRCASLAALALAVVRPAGADIVWEGRLVPAWPDAAAPRAASVARAELGTRFFPRPAGTVKALTLLVNFSDEPGAFTREEIAAWLNEPGYSRFDCNGSVRDYFKDVSNGAVELDNTVHAYYRAKNPKSYYEGGNGYERAGELMQELIASVDADVDFSEFDNDGDGRTEAISVVYAGPAVEWGQGLWPHAGGLNQRKDGVTLSRYQMTSMGKALSLYTFAHETGHMLFGWPDLYGFGDYCLMGNAMDAENPAGINDFFRADQGWIPAQEVTASTNARYTATVNGTGYVLVNPDNEKELFFWSNVQAEQRFSVLKGGGLLLLHYDGTIRGNNPPEPLQLAVVQADGKKDLDKTMWPSPGSDAADFFRGVARDEFSSTTTPRSNWNDGSASGLRVHSISSSGPDMTFAVGTGEPPPAGGTTSTGGAPSNAGSTPGGGAGRGGTMNAGGSSSGGASGGTSSGAGTASLAGSSSQGGVPSAGAPSVSGAAGASTSLSGGVSGSASSGGSAGGSGTTAGRGPAQRGGAPATSGAPGATPGSTNDSSGKPASGCAAAGPAHGSSPWLTALGLATALAFVRRRTRVRGARPLRVR